MPPLLKKPLLAGLVAAVLLTACGPTTSSLPTANAVQPHPATRTSTAAPTEIGLREPTATVAPTPADIAQPTQLPAVEPTYPPVTEADWQIGPTDALVTLIDYSDFQ